MGGLGLGVTFSIRGLRYSLQVKMTAELFRFLPVSANIGEAVPSNHNWLNPIATEITANGVRFHPPFLSGKLE